MSKIARFCIVGIIAGSVTGILGAGGGMLCIPLLSLLCKEEQQSVFQLSVAIMLPICIAALLSLPPADYHYALSPYIAGGAIGGTTAFFLSKIIPVRFLHCVFGILLLWGGIRALWS